jgi:2-methylisocitrate lyase-like PEP mutase family enzyme
VPRTSVSRADAFLEAGADGAVVSFENEAELRDLAKRLR